MFCPAVSEFFDFVQNRNISIKEQQLKIVKAYRYLVIVRSQDRTIDLEINQKETLT